MGKLSVDKRREKILLFCEENNIRLKSHRQPNSIYGTVFIDFGMQTLTKNRMLIYSTVKRLKSTQSDQFCSTPVDNKYNNYCSFGDISGIKRISFPSKNVQSAKRNVFSLKKEPSILSSGNSDAKDYNSEVLHSPTLNLASLAKSTSTSFSAHVSLESMSPINVTTENDELPMVITNLVKDTKPTFITCRDI